MSFHKKLSSHRKPRRPAVTAATARTAVTLAVASAVSATALTEPGQAAARPAPEKVSEQVDEAYRQARLDAPEPDGAGSRTDRPRRQSESLRDQLTRRATARDEAAPTRSEPTAGAREAVGRPVVDRGPGVIRRLLARLTSRRPAATDAPGAADGIGGGSPGAARAPDTRAARAVAFAYAQLGKPYVWGATGPAGYDCSGLTQAAWAAAGVALPRTTYTQIDAGTRVPRDRLAPGDLVFYYAGLSHVALYVGDGLVIHAPRPGDPVGLAPVGGMPFAGAARPA